MLLVISREAFVRSFDNETDGGLASELVTEVLRHTKTNKRKRDVDVDVDVDDEVSYPRSNTAYTLNPVPRRTVSTH